jgi:hypothetical protein
MKEHRYLIFDSSNILIRYHQFKSLNMRTCRMRNVEDDRLMELPKVDIAENYYS